jgi:hypothetical protein
MPHLRRNLCLYTLVVLLSPHVACGEEAVDSSGKRFRGTLMHKKDAWVFQTDQGKEISLKHLAYVHFEPASALLPKVRLTTSLLLPHGQRLTGSLVGVREKTVEFTASSGTSYTLAREQLVGLVHANDWLPILSDDFAAPLKGWKLEGNPVHDPKVLLFGKTSLRLDAESRLSREWPKLSRDHRIQVYFCCAPKPSSTRWTLEAILSTPVDTLPNLVIEGGKMHCANVREAFGSLETKSSWHGLSIERHGENLRFYVDDFCLGQTSLPRGTGIKGVRISSGKGEGSLWLDAFTLSERLPPIPMPSNDTDQDFIWLRQGEQLFGRIVTADRGAVVLDAKFGKRSFTWKHLRGIGFANTKPIPPGEAVVDFRPGSGFVLDCLHAKLIRWQDMNLIVQHSLFGEVAIERERLAKIRFEAK